MLVRNPKRIVLGKWNFWIMSGPDNMRMDYRCRVIQIALFKPLYTPPQGVEYQSDQYKGFMFRFRVWSPIVVDRWR